jgi:hypothetical protein
MAAAGGGFAITDSSSGAGSGGFMYVAGGAVTPAA